MAAPAVGYPALHIQQMHALINDALGIEWEKTSHDD